MRVSLLGATSTLQLGKGQLRVRGPGGKAGSGLLLMAALPLVSVLVEMLIWIVMVNVQ